MRVTEAARYIGVSVNTLKAMSDSGKIICHRIRPDAFFVTNVQLWIDDLISRVQRDFACCKDPIAYSRRLARAYKCGAKAL